MQISCVITAPMLPPVDSHALMIGGVVQGIAYSATPAKPIFGSKVANGAVDQRGDDEGQNQIGVQHDGQTKGHALVDLKDAGADAQFGDGTIICTLGEQEDRNDQTQSTTGAPRDI